MTRRFAGWLIDSGCLIVLLLLGAVVYALLLAPSAASTPRSESSPGVPWFAKSASAQSGAPDARVAQRARAPESPEAVGSNPALGSGAPHHTTAAPMGRSHGQAEAAVAFPPPPPTPRKEVHSAGQSNPVPATSPAAAASRSTVAGASFRGSASWWNSFGHGIYAAMGGYRDGTRVVALVESFHDGRTYSVTVVVSTQCGACDWTPGQRLIDLSGDAFLALGWPLSRGIAPVTVVLLEGSIR